MEPKTALKEVLGDRADWPSRGRRLRRRRLRRRVSKTLLGYG